MNFSIFNNLKSCVIKGRVVMTILVFEGVKGEGRVSFLRNYKRACINTWNKTTKNWVTFLPEFF